MLFDHYYRQAARAFVILLLVYFVTRITYGAFAVVLLLIGMIVALQRKIGLALCIYILFPLMVISNPYLLPKNSMLFSLSTRFAIPLIGIALIIAGGFRRGRYEIPLFWLLPYLMVMVFSSARGWFPSISYMKLSVFLIFILTLAMGVRGIQHSPHDVEILRYFLLAISAFVVLGSMALLPFPYISTLDAMTTTTDIADNFAVEEAVSSAIERGTSLFCGVTFQSQTLSPLVACIFGWVACDMLFIEKKIR